MLGMRQNIRSLTAQDKSLRTVFKLGLGPAMLAIDREVDENAFYQPDDLVFLVALLLWQVWI